jgi:hypothetical protein
MESLPGCGGSNPVGRATLGPRDSAAPPAAVYRITYHGMANVLQVNSDLVGAAGVQFQPEQVHDVKPGDYRGISSGGTASGGDDHAFAIVRMACDRRVNDERTAVQVTPSQSGIGAVNSAASDRRTQTAVGQIGFGHDHKAGRVAVEPVNDAGPAFSTPGQSSAPSYQRVDQSVVPVSRSGVNHQPRGLVNDREMLILEDDGQRNGARCERAGWLVERNADGDLLTAGQRARSACRLTIDADQFVGHQTGRLSARKPELIGQEPIEPLGFSRQDGELELLGRTGVG